MRMNTQRILAALLSLVLLLALAPAGWADGEEGGGGNGETVASAPVESTITVDLSANNYGGDIYKAKVMADLYLVVPAVKNEAYNSYDLDFDNFNAEFSALKEAFQKTIYGEKYGTDEYSYDPNYRPNYVDFMDNTVIPFVLDKEKSFTAVDSKGVSDETAQSFQFTGVMPGMYILVPHGSDLTEKKDYVKSVTVNTTDGTTGNKKLVSMAHSTMHEYLFTPQLIFVPTKDAVDDIIATWNPGDWLPELTVSLKSEQKPRLGDLKLVKTLTQYAGNKPVVAVFHVEAKYEDEVVFSDVYMFELNKDTTTQAVTIEKRIPIGAEITVTEMYSSSYTQVGNSATYTYEGKDGTENAETPLIELDKLLTATITNEPGETPPGAGVINRITYHPDNVGEWNVNHDNVAPKASGEQGGE